MRHKRMTLLQLMFRNSDSLLQFFGSLFLLCSCVLEIRCIIMFEFFQLRQCLLAQILALFGLLHIHLHAVSNSFAILSRSSGPICATTMISNKGLSGKRWMARSAQPLIVSRRSGLSKTLGAFAAAEVWRLPLRAGAR